MCHGDWECGFEREGFLLVDDTIVSGFFRD